MENYDFFATFLKINNLTKAEISRYLEKSSQYIGQCVKGTSKLSWDSIQKLRDNPFGWDCSMLPEEHTLRTTFNTNNGNNCHHFQNSDDCELWKRLCEEKDKRIAELERTIQILLNNGK